MNLLRIALTNVLALRRRLLGLVVLIAFAVGLCLTAFGIADNANAASSNGILESVANRSILIDKLSEHADAAPLTKTTTTKLSQLTGVASVEPRTQASFGYKDSQVAGVLLYATLVRPSLRPPVTQSTRPNPFPLRDHEAVLPARADGSDLTGLLGRDLEVQTVTKVDAGSGTGSVDHVKVVGLYDPTWQIDGPAAAYVDDSTVIAWAALNAGVPSADYTQLIGYDSITVLAKSSSDVPALLDQIQSLGLGASALQQQLSALPSLLGLIKDASRALLVVLAIVALVGTLALTGSLVRQRTREIGILKATGFDNRRIFGSFLLESLLTAVLAVGIGIGLGAVGAVAFGAVLRGDATLKPYLPDSLLLPSLATTVSIAAVTVLVVACGALTPALRAARMDPVDAMRDW